MSDIRIEEFLEETLADYRLTRSEKRSFKDQLAQYAHDEHKLAYIRSCAFQLAKSELGEARSLELLGWLEDVVKALQYKEPSAASTIRSQAYFSPADACVARILRLFTASRHSADVCVYTITDDRIRDAILEAHRRNVKIRIISDNEKSDDLGSDIRRLADLGVPVRVDRSEHHMHHKFAIFDEKQLLTGSYNWTRSAARHNEENFIVTNDAVLLRSFREAFDSLWKRLS